MSCVSVYAWDNCDCEEASGLRSTYWTHRAETTQQWEIWHKLLGVNEFPRGWECKRGSGGGTSVPAGEPSPDVVLETCAGSAIEVAITVP